jgi:long-subunit acyl-CoA synthetase (AMP-forming)
MSVNLLHERLSAFPDSRLTFCGRDGRMTVKTYAELHDDVGRLVAELRDCGVASRDVIGVLGENSYAWVVADLALLTLDCVSVVFPVDIQNEWSVSSLIDRYDLSALLLTDGKVLHGVLYDAADPSIATLDRRPLRLLKRTRTTPHPALTSDIFTVVFSSGTSGRRKGLVMTKAGIENAILVSGVMWDVEVSDNLLLVMPFTNFQQRYLLYLAIWFGSAVSVIAPERMFHRMRDVSPTIILGPPSFFEVLENRIGAESAWRKLPLYLATLLHAVTRRGRGWRARRMLCRRWANLYGSRVRLMYVGSAPSRAATVTLFHRVGLPLLECYGLTECGWIALNRPDDYRVGSVGRPVKGLTIEIADDGEVLVRSASPQSTGYIFEGTDEQSKVFLPQLTIATGDLGRRDAAGFLHLSGRKKNVIVTRSGLKINPEDIEAEIEDGCRVARAIVVGHPNLAALGCVVWLDDWQSADERHAVSAFVDAMNGRRPSAQHVGDVVFRPAKELSVESGLLTRNYKVNRTAVMTALSKAGGAASWAAS